VGAFKPGVEPLVKGGVIVGAEAVGLVVFVLVPSLREAGLLGIGVSPEVLDYVVVFSVLYISRHSYRALFFSYYFITLGLRYLFFKVSKKIINKTIYKYKNIIINITSTSKLVICDAVDKTPLFAT